jgi:hypothetical protein
MNKLGIFLLVFLLVLPFVFSEEPSLIESTENSDLLNTVENIGSDNRIISINSTRDIKGQLLENPWVVKADTLFQKGNIISLILFGVDYSFSLFFLVAVSLWIFFVLTFYSVLNGYSTFSPLVSFLMSIVLGVMNAQVGAINFLSQKISLFFLWCYSLFTGGQTLATELIVIIGFFILLGIAIGFITKFGTQIREERAKKKEESDRKRLSLEVKTSEALSNAVGKAVTKPVAKKDNSASTPWNRDTSSDD